MIISMDAQKIIWKNSTTFAIKTLNKLATEENFFNMVKGICEKPTVSIKLNGERLRAFRLRSGTTSI